MILNKKQETKNPSNKEILDEIIQLCLAAEWDERNNEYPHCTMRAEWEGQYPPHKEFVQVRAGKIAPSKTELHISVVGVTLEMALKREYIEIAKRKILSLMEDEKIPPVSDWSRR